MLWCAEPQNLELERLKVLARELPIQQRMTLATEEVAVLEINRGH